MDSLFSGLRARLPGRKFVTDGRAVPAFFLGTKNVTTLCGKHYTDTAKCYNMPTQMTRKHNAHTQYVGGSLIQGDPLHPHDRHLWHNKYTGFTSRSTWRRFRVLSHLVVYFHSNEIGHAHRRYDLPASQFVESIPRCNKRNPCCHGYALEF